MPPNALIFSVGEQIGPYRLVRHLGSGAFGEVWQAERDAGLEATVNVALKLQESRQFSLEQIKREVRVWSWVSDHPHILPFMGAEEYLVRGARYIGIASQYVAGGSLADWLKKQPGSVTEWPTACRIVCGILEGLEYMHGWRNSQTGPPAPIVHRDLKTANVLMNGEMPLLADLGLANIIDGSKDFRFSQKVRGTPFYISPEGWDKGVSPRVDLWAAGVILYELLSGDVPFNKPTLNALIKAIVMDDVLPLPVAAPVGVLRVLERALQKEESNRYQSAAAMRCDLAATLQSQQRELERRLATEEKARRAAEAEMARLQAEIAAQHQAQDDLARKQAQAQEEAARRAAEAAERQREAERQRIAEQRKQAEALRQAERERQKREAAAAEAKRRLEEERHRQPQLFVTPTPAKLLWPKVAGIGAAVLLSVSLLGYALSGGGTVSPTGGGSSAGDVRPTAVKAQDYTENLRNGIKLEMVAIPAGKFLMGSTDAQIAEAKKYCDGCNFDDEKPQHEVSVGAMYMGKYEVTQEQWQAVMGNNPSNFQNCPKCPVEKVSWEDAKEFIKKLNLLQNKYVYRLPSEAEWEYNARAGTKTAFAFGDSLASTQANFNGKYPYGGAAKGEYRQKTIPVGGFSANDFGLYDMHGNVWEWCEDIYADNYSGLPTDGSPNVSVGDSSYRMLRGGSWYSLGSSLRSANRFGDGPSARNNYLGVRVAASAR